MKQQSIQSQDLILSAIVQESNQNNGFQSFLYPDDSQIYEIDEYFLKEIEKEENKKISLLKIVILWIFTLCNFGLLIYDSVQYYKLNYVNNYFLVSLIFKLLLIPVLSFFNFGSNFFMLFEKSSSQDKPSKNKEETEKSKYSTKFDFLTKIILIVIPILAILLGIGVNIAIPVLNNKFKSNFRITNLPCTLR